MILYGRSWKELIPYMETYITKSKEIKDHPILSKEDVQTLADGKVAIDKLTTSLDLYVAKLVLLGEKGFNPAGGAPIPARGMTEIKGEQGKATGIMARLFGPLTPEPKEPLSDAELKAKEDREKRAIEGVTDALKDQIRAEEDLTDAKKARFDLDKGYEREMSLVGWDVGRARELTIRHGWAEEDQMGKVGEAQAAPV